MINMKTLFFALLFAATTVNAQQWQLQAVVDQQISCYGNNDGYIHAYVWYGSNLVTFKLKGRKYSSTNTDGHFYGLKTGTYTVTATVYGDNKTVNMMFAFAPLGRWRQVRVRVGRRQNGWVGT